MRMPASAIMMFNSKYFDGVKKFLSILCLQFYCRSLNADLVHSGFQNIMFSKWLRKHDFLKAFFMTTKL